MDQTANRRLPQECAYRESLNCMLVGLFHPCAFYENSKGVGCPIKPKEKPRNMNAREFFDKVALLRIAQKEYFATRSRESLNQAKALEREIDNEIERVTHIIAISEELAQR